MSHHETYSMLFKVILLKRSKPNENNSADGLGLTKSDEWPRGPVNAARSNHGEMMQAGWGEKRWWCDAACPFAHLISVGHFESPVVSSEVKSKIYQRSLVSFSFVNFLYLCDLSYDSLFGWNGAKQFWLGGIRSCRRRRKMS
jgi:hypothetical protein